MIEVSKLSNIYKVISLNDSDADSILKLCLDNPQFYEYSETKATKEQILKKVFLDTTPIIYFLDDNPNYSDKVEIILSHFIKQKIQIITSVITCSEYLILPYRTNNIEKEIAFFEFLNDCKIPICQIDLNTAKLASTIRAKYNYFKAKDCLQIAFAMTHNCDLFLTNDKQLKQFNAITCLTIDDLIKEL